MHRSCDNCIYADGCSKTGVCGQFFPCDPLDEEEFYDELTAAEIEEERSRFRDEWMKYIEDSQ